jgi:hypothetical protein
MGNETTRTGYIDSVLLKVLTNITSASNQIVKDLRSQPDDPRLHGKDPTNYRPRKPFGPSGIFDNALPEPKFVGTERTA